MYRSRSSNYIIHNWSDEVEQSLEAGRSPIVELGASTMATEDVISLAAVQQWTAQRADIATPYVPSGGSGPLWIASLMHPLRGPSQSHASKAVLLYAGVNEAEYLLTTAMLHTAVEANDNGGPGTSAIPVSYFAPQSQPGMSVSWDALPFLALDIAPGKRRTEADDLDDAVDQEVDPIEDWLAWACLLLALFLILLAILM